MAETAQPETKVGVFDKDKYYQDTLDRITIFDSIGLDLKLIEAKKKEGFDPTSLKTFLIGGCYSKDSIEAMIEFIGEINPNAKTRLIVTDINQEAFDLIRTYPIEVPENIDLRMFRGDLTQLALPSGLIDYVRMDYVENFIPLHQQADLLKEIHRITSENAIVASMMDVIPATSRIIEKIRRMLQKAKGSKVDTYRTTHLGFKMLLPSEEFIRSATKKAGFELSFVDSEHHYFDLDSTRSRLAVFEKPKPKKDANSTK
jgi:hypothetical protein